MKNYLTIKDISDFLDKTIPLSWQESYDNAGLLYGNKEAICTGVYVCFDINCEIIDNAIKNNCNFILSHHPLVYKSLKKFTGTDNVTCALTKAIENKVALYASHTNLDSAANMGVNTLLAEKIGLKNIRPLHKEDIADNGYFGLGAIGELEKETDVVEFLKEVKSILNIHNIKYVSGKTYKVKTIALCGGSGTDFIDDAIREKADCFLTGDIKYHQFLDYENHLILADIGHFESESFIKEYLISLLSEKFCNFVPLFLDNSANHIKNI
jgi:dinuclear metal center YbgI/SA1388 family protein